MVSAASLTKVSRPAASVTQTRSGDDDDEVAVALLGAAQLALEPLALGDVAGRRRGSRGTCPSSSCDADRVDLDRGPAAVRRRSARARRPARSTGPRRASPSGPPRPAASRGDTTSREVLADQLARACSPVIRSIASDRNVKLAVRRRSRTRRRASSRRGTGSAPRTRAGRARAAPASLTSRTVPCTPAKRPSSQTDDRRDLPREGRPVAVPEHVPEAADDLVLVVLLDEVRERLLEQFLGRQVGEGLAHDLRRRPAEQRLGALGHEQESAVRVASVDDVRRGLHELAEAGLGLAELALQAVALAHVADRPVRPRERPPLVEPGRGDELRRDGLAVAAQEVHAAAEAPAPLSARPTVQSSSATSRDDSCDERAEVLPDEVLGAAVRSSARRRPRGR